MDQKKIIPNLWFDNQAEAAVRFYCSVFSNSRQHFISTYGRAAAEVSGKPEGSVMTVDFELEGLRFVALNGGPTFSFTPATSFFIGCSSNKEIEQLYEVLSSGGSVLMPLDRYPFSDRYAWISDQYGLSWQLYLGETRQKITPCLMFVRNQYGRAAEAMRYYVSIFENSKIEHVVYHEKNSIEKEGTLKHAAFTLSGEQFITMDSGLDHNFTFSPAVSFQIRCENQKEIDYFWKNLSAVPEAEQCGWVQDKFAISWQIVPAILDTMMQDQNPQKTESLMKAMLPMKKLDLATLKRAYDR